MWRSCPDIYRTKSLGQYPSRASSPAMCLRPRKLVAKPSWTQLTRAGKRKNKIFFKHQWLSRFPRILFLLSQRLLVNKRFSRKGVETYVKEFTVTFKICYALSSCNTTSSSLHRQDLNNISFILSWLFRFLLNPKMQNKDSPKQSWKWCRTEKWKENNDCCCWCLPLPGAIHLFS